MACRIWSLGGASLLELQIEAAVLTATGIAGALSALIVVVVIWIIFMSFLSALFSLSSDK